jgi:hypothetical protein
VSKKTNQKKKVNIKLEPGQSFLIENLDLLMHIQKTYAGFLRGQISVEEKANCNRVIAAVNLAIENVHNVNSNDYGDEW